MDANISKLIVLMGLFIVGLTGCGESPNNPSIDRSANNLDNKLLNALIDASPSKEGPKYFTMPVSLEDIPQDLNNPINLQKVELGRRLFNETRLATKAKNSIGLGTYSCASCHNAQLGFQAGVPQGLGEGGIGSILRSADPRYNKVDIDFQPIRSPTAINVAYQDVMLWNGQFGALGLNQDTLDRWKPGTPLETNMLGFSGVETQAIAGMEVHRLSLNGSDLDKDLEYVELFNAAFPGQDKPFNDLNAALAMAAFERSLLSTKAPFQRWLRQDYSAMNDEEKEGALLFFTKAKCVSCHTGPALSSNTFHALGMKDLDQSHSILGEVPEQTRLGRGGFTGNPLDNFKFKTPQLYDLVKSPFYGHGASFTTIEQVVRYKNAAVKENSLVPNINISEEFIPLELSEDEIIKLTIFLEKSLKE